MGCAFDKELLTGYYDGELDAAEKARVERHIAGCSECLRDLGEIRSASQLVRKLAGPRMPQEVSERIVRAIGEERRRRFRGRWGRGLTGSLAVAAGIFLALNVAYFLRLERGGKPSDLAPAIGFAGVPEADEAERAKAREAKAEPAPARRKALQVEPQAPERLTDGRDLAGKAAGEEQKDKSFSSEATVGAGREKAVDRADKPVPAAPAAAGAPGETPKAPAPPPPAPLAKEKKEAVFREQEGPRQAPAPPPAAPRQEELLRKKDAGKAVAAATAPATLVEWTVRAADLEGARKRVEEALRRAGAFPAEAAAAPRMEARRAPSSAPIAVEITPEQLSRVQKELEGGTGFVLVRAGPSEGQRAAGGGVPRAAVPPAEAPSAKQAAQAAPAPVRVKLVVHLVAAAPEKK